MNLFETILVWGTVYLYTAVVFLLLTALIFKKEWVSRWVTFLIVPAFIVHTLEFGLRWVRTGYFPAHGDFENSMVGAWFVMAFTLYLYFGRRGMKDVALLSVPFALIFLGYGIMRDPVQLPLAVSLKSSWLIVHVLFANLAFGAAAIAAGLGVIYLLKDNMEKKGQEKPFLNRFPALPALEESIFKFVVYAFISMAIELAAGSIWAKELWGSYWSWDPVEVWNLSAFMIYGIALHLKLTLGWKARRLAWLYIAALIAIIITFWGVDLVVEKSHSMFRMENAGEVRQMMGK